MNNAQPINSPLHAKNIFRKVCATNNVDPEYLPDLLSIFQFIHQHDKVEGCLDQLEQSLQQYAAQQADKNHKIVSEFFYQWAQQNNFKQKAKIIDALPPDLFLNLLSTQTIFKDSTAMLNIAHGMWTHTIQWYCIFEYQRQTNFLQRSPMDIYLQLGKTSPEIWNYLLDRMGLKFYNCPEYLTNSVIEHAGRWPLLSATLTRQKEKLLHGLKNRGAYHQHLLKKHAVDAHNGIIVHSFTPAH